MFLPSAIAPINPDSAVEMDTWRVIKERAWRSEGTEANNSNAVFGLVLGWQFF
jgi:hypothetical protein